MIGACIEAYECTHGEEWVQLATTCFNWYLGKNDRQLKIYDHASGGCRDGLEHDGRQSESGRGIDAVLHPLATRPIQFPRIDDQPKIR